MDRTQDLMSLLKASLQIEFPTYVLVDSTYSNGDPELRIADSAAPASQAEVAFIRISQKAYTGFPTISLIPNPKDGSASVLKVAFEELTGHATHSCWSEINYSKLISRLHELTVDIEIYLKASGNIAAEADITSANLVGAISSNVRIPNMGQ